MSTQIQVKRTGTDVLINYLAYGTIGWLKTTNNEVHQCKCVGVRLAPPKPNYSTSEIEYKWLVAGMNEYQFGAIDKLDCGVIYMTEDCAQHGSASYNPYAKGILRENKTLSLSKVVAKYGLSQGCIEFNGCWYNLLCIKTYGSFKDGTCRLVDTDYDVVLTENGLDIVIPMLEQRINGIRRYATKKECLATQKPLKVYRLDDDINEKQTSKKVRVLIDVDTDVLDKVKALGVVISTI